MELNWTTFLLEIVNFLVLVWILKRFLYQPVLKAIAERRAQVQSRLDKAQQQQEQAQQLRSRFENRLAAWEQEKQAAREALEHEAELHRKQALQELEASLSDLREKTRVNEARRLRELEEQQEREALELGGRFAARLLQELAGPELEARILHRFGGELEALEEAEIAPLQRALQDTEGAIQVESAFPLSEAQRQALERGLRQRLGAGVNCRFLQQPELIAGLRLSLGDWSLAINLHDELKGFVDTAREID